MRYESVFMKKIELLEHIVPFSIAAENYERKQSSGWQNAGEAMRTGTK